MTSFRLLLILTLTMPLVALAVPPSSTTPPPPQAPYVQTPLPGSQWAIEIESPKSAPDHKPEATARPVSVPTRVQMTLGRNGVTLGEILYSDGRKSIFYLVDGDVLQKCDNSDEIAIFTSAAAAGDFQSLRVFPFPAVAWLSLAHYDGIDKSEKTECHHFSLPSQNKRQLELTDAVDVHAWIRVKDGFPVRIQAGDTIFRFSEISSYSHPVELPPAYQKACDTLRAHQAEVKNLRLQ